MFSPPESAVLKRFLLSFSFISFQSVFPKALLLSTQWKCLVGSFSYLMWRELGQSVRACVCVCAGGSTGSWQFVKGVWEEVEQPEEWVWLWAEGWTDRRGRMERRGLGLVTEVWNSYFVIWNMSEISNEIWSITASHTSQWNAWSVCVLGCGGVCVCVFWKRVVIFILKHWGVRWRKGADEGRRREGEREERRIFHLNLLVFHCPRWSFFFFFCFSFVWPLSGRAECSTRYLHA